MLIERLGDKKDNTWRIDLRPAQSLVRKSVPLILAAALGYSGFVSVKENAPEFVYEMRLKAEYAQMQKEENFPNENSYFFGVDIWGKGVYTLLQDYHFEDANPASIDSKIIEALSILNEGVDNRHLNGLKETYPFIREGIDKLLVTKYGKWGVGDSRQGKDKDYEGVGNDNWLMQEIGKTYGRVELFLGLQMKV